MYNVFINEKRLSFRNNIIESDKNIKFQDTNTFEIAVDLLENTSTKSVNIYDEDIVNVWNAFKSFYKNIEAAGGLVLNESEQVLFIYRLNKWDLPKGKAEKGETIAETAIREISEECSITNLELEEPPIKTYHMYNLRTGEKVLKTTHWFKTHYNGKEVPVPQKIEGITKTEWIDQDSIKKIVYPNTFENIKYVIKQFLDLKN